MFWLCLQFKILFFFQIIQNSFQCNSQYLSSLIICMRGWHLMNINCHWKSKKVDIFILGITDFWKIIKKNVFSSNLLHKKIFNVALSIKMLSKPLATTLEYTLVLIDASQKFCFKKRCRWRSVQPDSLTRHHDGCPGFLKCQHSINKLCWNSRHFRWSLENVPTRQEWNL